MPQPTEKPSTILAWMMFLVPALGVPSELLLQDTLKSAIVAFCVLGAAALFFWQHLQRNAPVLWHGLVCLPLLLMAYALGSMAWSHTYLAGVEAIRWFLLALLLWLGVNTFSRENLPMLMWGIHGGAVVASLWAALQFWIDLPLFPQGALPASTFANRNFFAEYAVCALPFSVWLLASLRAPRWLGWMALSVAFNVVALMMTGTRSALISLLVLCPVFVLILLKYHDQFASSQWSRGNKLMVATVLLAGVALLGSIPNGAPQMLQDGKGSTALQRSFLRTSSLAQATEYTEGSFSVRSTMWRATARMVLANPLTGVGAGAWEVQIPLYQNANATLETDYYAHNEFLQLLSEYGVVVGGLLLAIFLAYLLHAIGSTWRLRGVDRQEAPLRAFTLSSLLALLIVSNVGFPLHLAACGSLLAVCLAILGSSDARLGNHSPFFAVSLRWQPVYSQAALALLLISFALATAITHRAAWAEYKLIHAIHIANTLKRPPHASDPTPVELQAKMLQDIREGIALNPHYRKLTAELAEPYATRGDWAHAVWILESVAASRPHIYAIWTGVAMGYARLGQHERARAAYAQVQRLKPGATPTLTLDVILLSHAGQEEKAIELLNRYFDQGVYDYDMVQTAYALGYKTKNWPLAIRAQELRIATWPAHAADGHFRLGLIYAGPEVNGSKLARAAFKSGLALVPHSEKDNYRSQIPSQFRPD